MICQILEPPVLHQQLRRRRSTSQQGFVCLQKEVLALYRQCLRECRKKPQSTRAHFEKFVRDEFSRNITIEKRDFAAIEFLLRKGHRQLDVYSSPGIKDIR
ncbi:complex 1 protein domain-containing protein [Trichoderma novae-zelandiae]